MSYFDTGIPYGSPQPLYPSPSYPSYPSYPSHPSYPEGPGVLPAFAQPSIRPRELIARFRPLVNYGLREAQTTGTRHAMTEVVLIAYLMGRGYSLQKAHQLVESWEVDETFPRTENGEV